jgi:hypothetical protein
MLGPGPFQKKILVPIPVKKHFGPGPVRKKTLVPVPVPISVGPLSPSLLLNDQPNMSLYNGKFPISVLDEHIDVDRGGKPATITAVLKTMFRISLV